VLQPGGGVRRLLRPPSGPGLDGRCDAGRGRNHRKILIVTDYDDAELREAARKAGAWGTC